MQMQLLGEGWTFRECTADTPGRDWMPARVPGGVHTDLLALNLIPDPFVGDNELHVQWVAERDWEYRCLFEVVPDVAAGQRICLVCDGLDTLADVRLNGHTVGSANNAFRRYRWDVTSMLIGGENDLRIVFRSPVVYGRSRQAELPMISPAHSLRGGPYVRKAPCQFGWDWGPKLPPMGIWKDVYLEARSGARLEDVHVRQHRVAGGVMVTAAIALERWSDVDLRVTLRLLAPDGTPWETQAALESDATSCTLDIVLSDPELWWPNGYGDQPLYDVEVMLYHHDELWDRRAYTLGLRTLELRREPDKFGESFTFFINGVPIFAKGANWIPADSFPTRITDCQLEHLIRSAADAHMNMLRVWGGGLYEDDRFYDLCDRYGILVWQDFIFSCSTYPGEEAFFKNVEREAVENVRRLRHRASLALWCGNNEMESGWVQWHWDTKASPALKSTYLRLFHEVLPAICASEDPDRPYWPSSPSSGEAFQDPNGEHAGDSHYWGVWHQRQPFSAYRERYPRFMSEFGFQSLPPLPTILTYAGEDDLNMTSYIMDHHQRSVGGSGQMVAQMVNHFRLPLDFESLVYLTMVLQAEGIRYGVEHWRRNRHRVSGTLFWQLNDCWPVASWSSIDYFGRWKALHYAARRFYAPVLLSIMDQGTGMAVHVTNDLMETWTGEMIWSLENLDGAVLLGGRDAVAVPPLTSREVWSRDFADQVSDENRRELLFICELKERDRRVSISVASFVPSKHLTLTDPELSTALRETVDGFEIDVTARSLARFVWLELEGQDVVFSDNCFDLPAQRTVTVSLPAMDGWDAPRVEAALRLRSLVDSY